MIKRNMAVALALSFFFFVTLYMLSVASASQIQTSTNQVNQKPIGERDRLNKEYINQAAYQRKRLEPAKSVSAPAVFVQPYVDLSPVITNPAAKTGWNLDFYDEFTGSKSSNWILGYCWGNAHPDSPFYNKGTNYDLSSGTSLKLITKKENYAPSPYPVTKHFTSASVSSDDCSQSLSPTAGHLFKYGYFEIRSRNPFGQRMWPAFWFFGEPNNQSSWNEIDIFEFGVGNSVVLTNHYQAPSGTHQASNDWIKAMPGQTFGDTWVTYALKWEPNKIVWYINNKSVRIVTDQNGTIIPDVALSLMANSGNNEQYADFDLNLPETFPNTMEVDYIRTYKRPDHTKPDPVFTINGKNGLTVASALMVPLSASLPVTMDASTSYMPGHNYFVSVQECQSNGALVGTEAMDWLTPAQVATVDKFDLKAFAQIRGVTLQSGHYYRVKLAGASSWTENNQYIYVSPCANDLVFSINGYDLTPWPAPVNIAYSYGKPGIMMDAWQAVSCANHFFVSVQACNAAGVGYGTEVQRWLTPTEVNDRGHLDLRSLSSPFNLDYGTYYRVKLAAGSPWTERVQIIYVQPCATVISFKINGQSPTGLTPAPIGNGKDVILDGTASTLCNDNYFISVQKSYSNGNVFPGAPEIQQWTLGTAVGHFDIRAFADSKQLTLECGNYYRVKLAGGTPWVEKVSIIYIQPCSNINNSFMIGNDFMASYVDQPSYNYGDPSTLNVLMYAPNVISCDQRYFVSVQKRVNGVLTGTEAMAWLNRKDIYLLQTLGIFDLKAFASDPNQDGNTADGITLTNNSTYRVKFVAGSGGCNANSWMENVKIIYFGTGSG